MMPVTVAPAGRRSSSEDRHLAADNLLRLVAEDALGTAVPSHDDATEVHADDGVVRRINDGREHLCGLVRNSMGIVLPGCIAGDQ